MRLRSTSHWSDPRVKPPYGSVEVDRGHLLFQALGLIRCWMMNEGAGDLLDLLNPQSRLTKTGAAWGVSPRGLATRFNNTGEEFGPDATGVPFQQDGMIATRSTYSGSGVLFQYDSVDPRYTLFDGGAGTHDWRLNNIATFTGVAGFYPAGQSVGMAIVWQKVGATTLPDLYRNGAVFQTGGVDIGTAITSGVFDIGNFRGGGSGNGWVGTIDYMYIGTKKPAASMIQWVDAEPYVMFRPIIRRRYFVPAAAPGAPTIIFIKEHLGQGVGRGVLVGR